MYTDSMQSVGSGTWLLRRGRPEQIQREITESKRKRRLRTGLTSPASHLAFRVATSMYPNGRRSFAVRTLYNQIKPKNTMSVSMMLEDLGRRRNARNMRKIPIIRQLDRTRDGFCFGKGKGWRELHVLVSYPNSCERGE